MQNRWKLAVGACVLAIPAMADPGLPGNSPVLVNVQVQREITATDASGRKLVTLEPVKVARPGDVLVYTLRAHNGGIEPAFQARLEDAIPAGTVLIPASVGGDGARVMASLDGGGTWRPFPIEVEHRSPDGRLERAPAPPEAYTNLRWVAERIDPGQERAVSFKVRIQ
ncbi:MAG TPA: hypothetical protein VJS92_15440 [Candidatus Polarisedimenticolaceae bacterium]|nr:hypothetical protein [Candidatus Polarisedimenticolaceae bacterium]